MPFPKKIFFYAILSMASITSTFAQDKNPLFSARWDSDASLDRKSARYDKCVEGLKEGVSELDHALAQNDKKIYPRQQGGAKPIVAFGKLAPEIAYYDFPFNDYGPNRPTIVPNWLGERGRFGATSWDLWPENIHVYRNYLLIQPNEEDKKTISGTNQQAHAMSGDIITCYASIHWAPILNLAESTIDPKEYCKEQVKNELLGKCENLTLSEERKSMSASVVELLSTKYQYAELKEKQERWGTERAIEAAKASGIVISPDPARPAQTAE